MVPFIYFPFGQNQAYQRPLLLHVLGLAESGRSRERAYLQAPARIPWRRCAAAANLDWMCITYSPKMATLTLLPNLMCFFLKNLKRRVWARSSLCLSAPVARLGRTCCSHTPGRVRLQPALSFPVHRFQLICSSRPHQIPQPHMRREYGPHRVASQREA